MVRSKGGFHLLRYFTLTSLFAFTIVGIALFVLERQEETFFEQVQTEQTTFFSKVQSELSSLREDTARDGLLAVHEAGHVNLTRFLANTMWETSIAPFMSRVKQLPVKRCRTMAISPGTAGPGQDNFRTACFREIGKKIMALPGFSSLDATAYAAMRASTVFKIKVFDLHGITVYSSEHAQMGEDKAGNLGWKTAVNGLPASELTHRDRFSAFEGVVENRDLISSYVPVRATGNDEVIGVFEIYSDVTPFLKEIKEKSAKIREITTANEARVERAAAMNQQKVHSSSDKFLAIVGGLLALLYVALLVLVRNGQRIIDDQHRAQERATHREQQWHREKMNALATMAAHVSHEIGNPLATISGLAEDIASRHDGGGIGQPKLILEQTQRIAGMVRQIADFAAARSEKAEIVDVNQLAKAMCDFLSFDSRFRFTVIEFSPDKQLRACILIPDLFNEILMNLLLNSVDGTPPPKRILLGTKSENDVVRFNLVREPVDNPTVATAVFSSGRAPLDATRRRLVEMGGELLQKDTGIEFLLPTGTVPIL